MLSLQNVLKTSTHKTKTTDESKVSGILELIKVLKNIDTESPLAELNKTTISDNNGGRIEL